MKDKQQTSRRDFLINGGRLTAMAAIGGTAWRLIAGKSAADSEFMRPGTRYGWRINPEKCSSCGLCETSCVRKPSAVKAVNDQKKCSNCIVCHGHLLEESVATEKIDSEGVRVCPYDAVKRHHFGGDYYQYSIDDKNCVGCGKCSKRCEADGTKSLFLIVRPDLCLNCNQCSIALVCPEGAIERVPIYPEDNYRGEFGMDEFGGGEFGGDMM